jgi:hypothetical protein
VVLALSLFSALLVSRAFVPLLAARLMRASPRPRQPLTLGTYGLDGFRGSNYILARLGYLHQIGQLPTFLGGKSYILLLVEDGSAFERLGAADFHSDVTGGLYLDTLLGPAFFGGSWGGGGRSKLFFSIGQLF